ncbi:hypothetical protein [Flagellimonas beolgyonensis]|uniref:hypothetical protein n=1 Tax=Flagellimonas beolgyonensis TaxID=864064 RepID=UPI003D65D318
MVYTWITLTLVGSILLFWLYKLMCKCFCRAFCIWKNQTQGALFTREATILAVNTLKLGKKPLLELLLLFENLSGQTIQRKIRVWDSKPELSRFVTDQKVQVTINSSKRPKDPISLTSGNCRISFAFLLGCSLKIILYSIGCYIFMGEALERITSNPEKYESILARSEIWQMGLIFAGVILFLHFLLQKIGLVENGSNRAEHWDLLYNGIYASATLDSYKDTGAMVNDNPVVQFSYTFKDFSGVECKGSDRKVVGKLEVGALSEIDHVDIMYLADCPEISRLTENLENNDLSSFTRFLLLLVLFVFSSVIIVAFYQNIF